MQGLASLLVPKQDEAPLPGAELAYPEWLAVSASLTAPMAAHHERAWEWFDGLKLGVKPRALIECWPRGHGKSSTVELGIVRSCVRRSRKFWLYCSRTQEAADRHVQSIAEIFESLGIERAVNRYGYSKGWSASMLRTNTGFSVLAFGLDAGARGVKLGALRPDGIVLDDIDELGDSAARVEKKEQTITQGVIPAGSIDAAIVFVQNRIHANSIMSKTLSGDLRMLANREDPAVIIAVEGLRTEERGGRDIIVEGVPTWSGKDLEICQQEIDDMTLQSFLRECQQEVGAGGLLFGKFREAIHECTPFAIPRHWKIWASHDYGTNAPACSHVFCSDEAGDIYVLGEHYQAGQESSQQCQSFLDLCARLGVAAPVDKANPDGVWDCSRVELVAFDYASTFPPENPEQRLGEYPVEVWWRRGVPAVRAVKDRKAGWSNGGEWIAARRDGNPRMWIVRGAAPRLVKFLSGAMSAVSDPDELDAGYRDDHAGDSWRYGLMVRPYKSPPAPEAVAQNAAVAPRWMQKRGKRKL